MSKHVVFGLVFCLCAGFSVHATTVDELIYSVLETGKPREARITKGRFVELMRSTTGSTGIPLVKVSSEGRNSQGCWQILQDTTMPNIPSRDGKIIGDYRTVARIIACPNGANPIGAEQTTVLVCEIGGQSCMPR